LRPHASVVYDFQSSERTAKFSVIQRQDIAIILLSLNICPFFYHISLKFIIREDIYA
jgi:hypothetical protein